MSTPTAWKQANWLHVGRWGHILYLVEDKYPQSAACKDIRKYFVKVVIIVEEKRENIVKETSKVLLSSIIQLVNLLDPQHAKKLWKKKSCTPMGNTNDNKYLVSEFQNWAIRHHPVSLLLGCITGTEYSDPQQKNCHRPPSGCLHWSFPVKKHTRMVRAPLQHTGGSILLWKDNTSSAPQLAKTIGAEKLCPV